MKKILALVIGVGLIFLGAGSSHAIPIPYSDTVDFFITGTDAGRTYQQIGDNSSLFNFNFSHNVNFVPPAASITSAQIVLSHKGNSNTAGEVWFLYGGTSTSIGQLNASTAGNGWVDQTFVLPTSLYSAISGGNWALALTLQESTNGTDTLWIDKSVLSGSYEPQQSTNPVPEPGTMVLFGAGLLGLVIYGKRRIS